MNYIDALRDMFQDGTDSLWRAVKAMPQDKIAWHPSEDSRSAQELLEELVMTTAYVTVLLKEKKDPGYSGGEEKDASLENLEKMHRANIEALLAAAKEFPEAELQNKVELPWGTWTFFQVITYPYWNLMYHYGQVSYIQTLYGDKNFY